jgi:hypothetical protein
MPGKKILNSNTSAYPREAWRLHHQHIVLFCQPFLCEYLDKDQNTMSISLISAEDLQVCLYVFVTRDEEKWTSFTWFKTNYQGVPYIVINHDTPQENFNEPRKDVTLSLWKTLDARTPQNWASKKRRLS